MNEQKERFNSMAEEYDTHASIIVPKYNEMQEVICQIIKTIGKKEITVLDLGAGSGILLNKIGTEFNSKIYWQDFSEDFMNVARKKPTSNKTTYIISDLNQKEWNKDITAKFDVIVSSNAIHHLKNERKKELYAEIFEMLTPGGIFINADEVKGESDSIYLMYLNFWNNHVNEQYNKGKVSKQMKEIWDKYVDRNITNFGMVEENPKDIHAQLVKQLNWMQEIGFGNLECFWKNYLWAIFGGFKK